MPFGRARASMAADKLWFGKAMLERQKSRVGKLVRARDPLSECYSIWDDDWAFAIPTRSICCRTEARFTIPGKRTSGSTTCENVGQNSGLFFHSVPDNSEQAPLRISHLVPFDLTIVVHFGHRVCIAYRSLGH